MTSGQLKQRTKQATGRRNALPQTRSILQGADLYVSLIAASKCPLAGLEPLRVSLPPPGLGSGRDVRLSARRGPAESSLQPAGVGGAQAPVLDEPRLRDR